MEEFAKGYPEHITHPINMAGANEFIPIYEGNFKLIQADIDIEVSGNIWFDWFPKLGAKFKGRVVNDYLQHENTILITDKFELNINGLKFGDCYINRNHHAENIEVEGSLIGTSVLGDQFVPVNKIKFAVPNLREFFGSVTKKKNGDFIQTGLNRLIFDNDDYTIVVDKSTNYKLLLESLEAKGGYVILFSGEITKKRGNATLSDLREILHCFSTFLDSRINCNSLRG